MITEIRPGVYWVGVVDWGLQHFHGHELSTHRGSSYNSYLIVDEQIALVDTVWSPFTEQLLANIREVVDPERIDYVIATHGEVDHSGALPAVMREARHAQLIVSKRGVDSLSGHYHADWPMRPVKTGDSVSLGAHTLSFVEAPMLHWPDTMFVHLSGHNMLISSDAFGQHYAAAFRFNDLANREELYEEALKYYANILTPFSDRVLAKIDELLGLGLPVEIIAPSHGVIWRSNPLQIVHQYAAWARQEPQASAVVVYDTMWNATRLMAEAIGDGLAAAGVPHKLFHAATTDRNDLLTEIFQAKAILIGSPTLNRGVLPSIAPLLEDLHGLAFKHKIGAAFGSYGWSGEHIKEIEAHLERAHIHKIADGVRAKWQPTREDLANCRALGQLVAAAIREAPGLPEGS